MFYISQSGKSDCGFACLAMLLANYHKDRNYLFLKHEDRQFNFRELISIAKKYNMVLLGVKVTDTNELLNCKEFPFVALIKNKNKENHCVIVKKITKTKVFIYDPSLGKRVLSFNEFIDRWTRIALIVKSFTKTKCPYVYPSFIRRKDKVFLVLLQLVGSLSLLCGTFFIDKQSYFFLPIIFFSLFIIFEILFRDYLLRSLKKLDESIFHYEIIKPSSGYQEVFKTIEEFKANSLTLVPNLICSLLIISFVSIIIILNNYINFVYIILCLALAVIESFIAIPKFHSEEAKLIELENEVYSSQNDYQFKFHASKATEHANNIGHKKILFRYVEIAILLISSILLMYFTGVANVTYVVFYLCINLFLIDNLTKMFDYAVKRDNFHTLKAKLINYLK